MAGWHPTCFVFINRKRDCKRFSGVSSNTDSLQPKGNPYLPKTMWTADEDAAQRIGKDSPLSLSNDSNKKQDRERFINQHGELPQ